MEKNKIMVGNTGHCKLHPEIFTLEEPLHHPLELLNELKKITDFHLNFFRKTI